MQLVERPRRRFLFASVCFGFLVELEKSLCRSIVFFSLFTKKKKEFVNTFLCFSTTRESFVFLSGLLSVF